MFKRDDPAKDLTKFEQAAMRFTAAALPYFLKRYDNDDHSVPLSERVAAQFGIDAAKEFCRQMEEREKDVESKS